jgi:thiamine pyrophosphate-dependent acetolactate synthase large subunit-like protein
VNFAQVAEAMGGADIRVGRPEDIRPALEKAMAVGDMKAMTRTWRDHDTRTEGGKDSTRLV